jgi:integrase
MPSPEKREGKLTGHWYGEVRIKGGERFRRRFDTKKGAAGYEAYVKATGEEPANLKDAKLAGPTFKETVVLMRASRKGSRDPSGTRRLDYLVDKLGHLTLPAIDTTVLDKLVADLEKRPAQVSSREKITDATINRYLSAFSGVITFARARVKDGEQAIVPPVIPWRKEAGKRIHWWSQEQEDIIVPWMIGKGWHAEALAMRVLCATGMRWGEFAGLEPHQCQPEWVLLDETKTDTPRDVPIDEALARELKAMVVTGTVPTYRLMRTRLKEAVKACGQSPKLGIHNTRHGTATQLIKAGTPLPVVQDLLGHKSIKTTMKYVHVENEDRKNAMRNLRPHRGQSGPNGTQSTVVPFMKSTG